MLMLLVEGRQGGGGRHKASHPSHVPGVWSSSLQTVLNTMCGYGQQQVEERVARQKIFTVGCLEKIVWWAKNNLLLVAGLACGLLLLEVTSVQLLSWEEIFSNILLRPLMFPLHM